MKTGLVLEGGAMRGIYTAGVLDVFMEHDISFDGVIGVSAGALFGVNLLSKQKGRVIRYNKRFNGDKNYMGLKPLLKTGNIIDTRYAYYEVPLKLDLFDNAAFMASKVPFYAVVTNIETGEAEYIQIKDVFAQMETLRASASMPFVSKPVALDGKWYLDGAVADSIPYEKTKAFYDKKYADFADKLRNRHSNYNRCMERIKAAEKENKLFVIRPTQRIKIKRTETDPQKMQTMYELGLRDANDALGRLMTYMKKQ